MSEKIMSDHIFVFGPKPPPYTDHTQTKGQQPQGAGGDRGARPSAGRRAIKRPVSARAHPSAHALGEMRGLDSPAPFRHGPQKAVLHTLSPR